MVRRPVLRLSELVVLIHVAARIGVMAVAWLCLGSFAHTARADSCALVLRVAEPADEALLERVRGQTSDLSCSLSAQASAPLERTLGEQLETARTLAVSGGARMVGWAERTASQLKLTVVDVASGRVLVRELPRGDGARDKSAQEEAAALVVRSALKASLAGQPLGEPAPAPVVAAREPIIEVAPVQSREKSPPPRLRGSLGLGMLGGADGTSERGHYGVVLRVALQRARLELGLRGSFGLSSRVSSSLADVQLAQHRAGLYAGVRVLETVGLSLSLLSGASLHVFTTEVASTRTGFVADDSRRVLASLSAGARLDLWSRRRVGVALGALLEVFPRPLELGYQNVQRFTRSERAWPLQPSLSVELVLRL